MKKATLIIFAGFLLTLPVMYIKAKHFWRGETMNLQKVCKIWGTAPLDLEAFKKATEKETEEEESAVRAKMACSLLQTQKTYIGTDSGEIMKLFGSPDGHYFSDMIPAYIIGGINKTDKNTWQIVFLIDNKERISKIIVHKNCCD